MRRKFFWDLKFLAVLCLVVILSASISAQSNIKIKGMVLDAEDGSPISGAVVSLDKTAYQTVSDNRGRYAFSNIPPGEYTVIAGSIGHESGLQSNILVYEENSVTVDLRLERKVYYVGKIRVKASRQRKDSDGAEVLFRDEIEQSRADNLPELLESIPGILIQQTGTSTGPAQVKIRGASSEQILVLIDGHKINPSGSGVADLSSIPLAMVERVEVHKGGASAEFGPDALGGVINIITRSAAIAGDFKTAVRMATGKWGTRKYQLSVSDIAPADNFSGQLAYSRIRSDGDFDYDYEIGSYVHSGTRRNNKSLVGNYFLSGLVELNSKTRLNFSGQWYDARRGLPGTVKRPNEYGRAEDARRLANLQLIHDRGENTEFRLDMAFSRYEQQFYDTLNTNTRLRFYSEFKNDIFTLKFGQNLFKIANMDLHWGGEWRRDILYHDNHLHPSESMGKSVRNNIGLMVSGESGVNLKAVKVFDRLILNGAVRFDYSGTVKDSTSWMDTVRTNNVKMWSPKIGLALSKGRQWSYVMRISYGKSFRLPSLNALFWEGGVQAHGNPGLKPERVEHSEAGLELRGSVGLIEIAGGITYFHNLIRDIIIWVPRVDAWQPVNMDRAQITGHEDFLELSFFGRLFNIKYQNSISTGFHKSARRTIDRNQLPFVPHYLTSYTLGFDWKYIDAGYSIRLSDSASILPYNTVDKFYQAYRVDDFYLGLKYRFRKWQLRAEYRVNNLNDNSYVVLTHHPMPGREWNLGVEITYGLKK